MAWRQLLLKINQSVAQDLSDWLMENGAQAITFEDSEDQPILEPGPGETPLWEKVTLIALFEEEDNVEAIESYVKSSFPNEIAHSEIKNLEEQVWERTWMDHFEAMKFGSRLWICPSWQQPPEPDAINIMLDPGLAFGSGTHETTALCLTWLDSLNLSNKSVIDYGCGSGILAIAACKLGAAKVIGTDTDPQAILSSRENANRNEVDEALLELHAVYKDSPPELPQVDVLVANILAEPLRLLAPQLSKLVKSGGCIGLSGILNEQAEEIQSIYQQWFQQVEISHRGDWSFISGIKP